MSSDFFGKIHYWQSFLRLFLEILYKRVFVVANYEMYDGFTKFEMADAKYLNFTVFQNFQLNRITGL